MYLPWGYIMEKNDNCCPSICIKNGLPIYVSPYLRERSRIAEELFEYLRKKPSSIYSSSLSAMIWKFRPRFPYAACFNVHGMCNSRCVACPYRHEPLEHRKRSMDFSLYKKLLSDFIDAGGRIFTFNNFSDIFARDEGMRYILYGLKFKEMAQLYLVTNAIGMAPSKIDTIFEHGFEGVVWASCHGFSPASYKKFAGIDAFDVAFRHIVYLAKKHPHPERIVVQCASDFSSVNEIAAAREFWAGLGVSFNTFSSHTFAGNSGHKRTTVTSELRGCAGWGNDAGLPFYQIVIQENGDVSLCCMDLKASVILGNASYGICNVWNGPEYQSVIEEIYCGRPGQRSSICKKCSYALVSA